jgi:hypothetical protein
MDPAQPTLSLNAQFLSALAVSTGAQTPLDGHRSNQAPLASQSLISAPTLVEGARR